LADYRALTDVDLRTRWEPPHGLFIAEGELVLGRALRAGYRPRSLLVDAKRVDDVNRIDRVPDVDAPLYAATQDVLEATTGFHVHRGILASFHRRPRPDAGEVLAAATRVAAASTSPASGSGRRWNEARMPRCTWNPVVASRTSWVAAYSGASTSGTRSIRFTSSTRLASTSSERGRYPARSARPRTSSPSAMNSPCGGSQRVRRSTSVSAR